MFFSCVCGVFVVQRCWNVCSPRPVRVAYTRGHDGIHWTCRTNSNSNCIAHWPQQHLHTIGFIPSDKVVLRCSATSLAGGLLSQLQGVEQFSGVSKTVLRELPEDASIPGQQQGCVRPMPESSPSPGGVKLVLSFQLLHTRRQTRGSRRN